MFRLIFAWLSASALSTLIIDVWLAAVTVRFQDTQNALNREAKAQTIFEQIPAILRRGADIAPQIALTNVLTILPCFALAWWATRKLSPYTVMVIFAFAGALATYVVPMLIAFAFNRTPLYFDSPVAAAGAAAGLLGGWICRPSQKQGEREEAG